ncbi:N-acetylmuramoyl-L-alanine amidase [Echinicola strongylocentroti]|uniref:N-acetylmuramoyl-L-alanine amidase n=1 Tax=Echinicola strongylocentroti TaxID=1795355 RepID=A0A2Z4IR03_9BACT|nr:N-acetylmuramoyl-L-alanine amidase [Echinicola strongylocentroti]AWW33088.1 N-acetylmuramoyl-L-alanine amidase [Echinicola strongylocentroti]
MKRTSVKNVIIILFLTCITLLSAFVPAGESARKFKMRRVVIDAGHGGKDPGTMGSRSKEKDVALSIALKVGNYIKQYVPDVEVIYTRKTDVFIELKERANIANRNKADLFVSIHCNAVRGSNAYGTETYVMGSNHFERNFDVVKRENSVILQEDDYKENYEGFDPNSPESYMMVNLMQKAYFANSLSLAQKVETDFKTRLNRHSRGVKQLPLYVLWTTSMPSVLIETGFLSNSNEERYLNSENGQAYIASAIYRSIKSYKEEVEAF